MPSKNTIREYDTTAFYHVYDRDAGGATTFHDAQDKRKFIKLLERYLVDDEQNPYPTYEIELTAYCVMGNHFHLLLFQDRESRAITEFMRSVSTAYAMYYNLRYKNKGHVFQGVFRAVRISNDSYLLHISRYIHLNPRFYLSYQWSSLAYFTGEGPPAWLHPERVNDLPPAEYNAFLESYTDRRQLLQVIKDELALS